MLLHHILGTKSLNKILNILPASQDASIPVFNLHINIWPDFLLIFCDNKLMIFGIWTVDQTEQDI